MATVPADAQALEPAGIGLDDVKAFKTHNPFAVNDVYFCKKTGVAPARLSRFGSPLVYVHSQGPIGLRAIIELIEELRLADGGYGPLTGCAAGDTAMAVALKVG
jgi:acetyl-CoA C-acetyltransferase